MEYDLTKYRNGGDGCIAWIEDCVRIPVYSPDSLVAEWIAVKDLPDTPHPVTGKSYKGFWEFQQDVLREALVMKNGRFIHRLIILCFPRGESKSALVVLMMLWRFFNWPKVDLIFCSNSVSQTQFVHFEIARNIILNSPKLLAAIGGHKNAMDSKLVLRDRKGNAVSTIRKLSSFSGIASNINGYAFSEIWQMKNPEFFSQIDGSIRNVPNAFGAIDSTVSGKTHLLYSLYTKWKAGKTPDVYFNYRFSKDGNQDDYQHPDNTQAQLDSYRSKFVGGAFERFFLNLFSSGADRVLSDAQVEAISYLGVKGDLSDISALMAAVEKKVEILSVQAGMEANQRHTEGRRLEVREGGFHRVTEIEKTLVKVNSIYNLRSEHGAPKMADLNVIDKLTRIYDTNWALLVGLDRADPIKTRTSANTVLVGILKGLPGSLTYGTPGVLFNSEMTQTPKFIYFMVYFSTINDHGMLSLKKELTEIHTLMGGIDVLCAERWGVWDLVEWCEGEIGCLCEMVYPTYDRQRAAFTELTMAITGGLFKCPDVAWLSPKGNDLFVDELRHFDHDPDAKWFGSPEKKRANGVQDDSLYASAWAIYGGRTFNLDNLKRRTKDPFFGSYHANDGLLGVY